jgi:uncharacterized membrane protein
MNNNIQEVEDRKIEIILGNLLRIGVIISASVVVFGAVIFVFKHGFEAPNYISFHKQNAGNWSIKTVVNGVLALHSYYIILLGIYILVATPVLRVAFSVVAFIYEKDKMYVIFTLIVLTVLLYSFLG